MLLAWLVLFLLIACGVLSWGLLLGDILSKCEEIYKTQRKLGGKSAKLKIKSILISAFVVRMLLGTILLTSTVIYRLIMRHDFRFEFFLPKDFWEKYFDEKQP